jgi:uridine kinase
MEFHWHITVKQSLDASEVDMLVEKCPRSPSAVILIDGASGAGKSELASLLAARWRVGRTEVPTLVRMDDIYPGWDGLDAGSRHVFERVLEPRSSGSAAAWRRFDWATERAAEWTPVDPNSPLIVEGAGSLSRAAAPLASLRIWLDEAAPLRKQRALKRDRGAFEAHWDRWAAQEEAFFDRERPDLLANVVVQGGAIIGSGWER